MVINSLKDIKGVGDKTELSLNELSIFKPIDLLKYLPIRYEKFDEPKNISDLLAGDIVAVKAVVIKRPSIFGRRMPIVTTILDDGTGKLKAIWFNSPFLLHTLFEGKKYIFRGRIYKSGNTLSINQAKIYTEEQYELYKGKMIPIYKSSKSLKSSTIYKLISNYLSSVDVNNDIVDDKDLIEYIPKELLDKNKLLNLKNSYLMLHSPVDSITLDKAKKRLIYGEFLLYELGLLYIKKETQNDGIKELSSLDIKVIDNIIKKLPYKLTNGQNEAIDSIIKDFKNNKLINRLIEGDVGSGKTIVAVLAMLYVAFSKFQSAFMAPTEVLARQHYQNINNLIKDLNIDINIALLTGSTKKSEREKILLDLKNGDIDILIGTHALYSNDVIYNNLALAIIDEQQRFGVNQRKKLSEKSEKLNIIHLSATPIPRTLSMLLFNGMDISLIKEKPEGRIKIKTAVVSEDYREKAYNLMQKEIDAGNKCYVICPMIDSDDETNLQNVNDYAKNLKKVIKGKIDILHGKMKDEEKEKVMTNFVNGDTSVLVSTTVVEVGIDSKDATFILIENAECFGLSTLHQLRGRVGRKNKQSYCVLIDSINNEKSIERLSILKETDDGFYIAEKDLELRGAGDVFGVKQSGELGFIYADVYSDKDLLELALNDAKDIVNNSLLDTDEYNLLKCRLDEYLKNGYTI